MRHADAVQQYQEQLQREEEERRRAAEFKVGSWCGVLGHLAVGSVLGCVWW